MGVDSRNASNSVHGMGVVVVFEDQGVNYYSRM